MAHRSHQDGRVTDKWCSSGCKVVAYIGVRSHGRVTHTNRQNSRMMDYNKISEISKTIRCKQGTAADGCIENGLPICPQGLPAAVQ